jgi:hypothetical protein
LLAAVGAERAACLALRLQPWASYFSLCWPIDAIWQANQASEVSAVALASGGTCIEIHLAFDLTTALKSVFAEALAVSLCGPPELETLP